MIAFEKLFFPCIYKTYQYNTNSRCFRRIMRAIQDTRPMFWKSAIHFRDIRQKLMILYYRD